MCTKDSHMLENWYLLHFRDRIKMQLRKEWHIEKKKSAPIGQFHILPIDPKDVGREYDSDVIRINSQSGKGGVNYILKQSFGISLPEKMREEVGYLVKDVSDKRIKNLLRNGFIIFLKRIIFMSKIRLQLMNAILNREME